MKYSEWIDTIKDKWIGKTVRFQGKTYTVVDVDYNGALLIDKKAEFTDTTAVAVTQLDDADGLPDERPFRLLPKDEYFKILDEYIKLREEMG